MQKFRPESTLQTTNLWTGVGSANLWDCINEPTPDDSDFIYCANASSGRASFALELPYFHPPAGTCYVRWRESSADSDATTKAPASGGNRSQHWVQIVRSGTLVAQFGPFLATDGAWTTREGSFDSTPISNWAVVSVRVLVSSAGSGRAMPDRPPFRAGEDRWDRGAAGSLVSDDFFGPDVVGDGVDLRGVAISWLEVQAPGGRRVMVF